MKILISYSRWHPGNHHSKLFYFCLASREVWWEYRRGSALN